MLVLPYCVCVSERERGGGEATNTISFIGSQSCRREGWLQPTKSSMGLEESQSIGQ